MKLINESLFDEIAAEVLFDKSDESILTNPALLDDYKKYILIAQYPFKFKDIHPTQLYYNKYYYFLRFLVSYQKLFGYDAGIEPALSTTKLHKIF